MLKFITLVLAFVVLLQVAIADHWRYLMCDSGECNIRGTLPHVLSFIDTCRNVKGDVRGSAFASVRGELHHKGKGVAKFYSDPNCQQEVHKYELDDNTCRLVKEHVKIIHEGEVYSYVMSGYCKGKGDNWYDCAYEWEIPGGVTKCFTD